MSLVGPTTHRSLGTGVMAWLTAAALACLAAASAEAQPSELGREPPAALPTPPAPAGPQPFGANLFTGSYAAQREDGLNPDYRILPGDRVMVNAWGSVSINDVFGVDTQGNIFLPGIGPVQLAGVRNDDLTDTVRAAIMRTYRGQFGVYTNLLTASPVAVFVTGGVRRPGRYAGIPSDSPLFFLDQAGGIEAHGGSYRQIRILRQGAEIAALDLYAFILRGQLPTLQLTDGDVILVGRRGATVEVRRGGLEPMIVELPTDRVRGAELLELVSHGARVSAVTVRGVRDGQPTVRTVDINVFADATLRDGDSVAFREDLLSDTIVVRLEGELQGHSELAVRRGARLLDVLNYVRVDPELAHTRAVYIRRQRVAEEQRRALLESLDRLERSAALALSDTISEAAIRSREAEMVRAFVDRARQVQPLGRMVTTSSGRELNVLLQEGDVIVIPTRTTIVSVVGEVQIPHAVQYRPDLRVHDYVRMAGGYGVRADRGTVIVTRANAEIVVGGGDTPIYPGDELIIPPAVDDKWVQNGIDIAGVMYQIAIATAVLLRPLF